MLGNVTCSIEKMKELILEAYPEFYEIDEVRQRTVVEGFVKTIDVSKVLDFMRIKEVTQAEATKIIDTREPIGQFYTIENGLYVGIDNLTGDAWTESFNYKESCLGWLSGEETEG